MIFKISIRELQKHKNSPNKKPQDKSLWLWFMYSEE